MLRIKALLAAVLMLAAIALTPAAASAADVGVYHWTGSSWRDTRCDDYARGNVNHRFEVTIYRDTYAGGPRTLICGESDDYCNVPLVQSSSSGRCSFLDMAGDGERAHDRVSSVYVAWVADGYDVCLYVDTGFGGSRIRLSSAASDLPNLIQQGYNDRLDSMRFVGESQSC